MRAFAIDAFGQPGSVRDLPKPEPAQGEVLVKVRAASINPFDGAVLAGYMKDRLEHQFPLIPSADFAGTVEAAGPGVETWKVGDEVFGIVGRMTQGHGTLAEFVAASAGTIARRSASIDPEFGAALPLTAVSALQCVEPMGLKHGDVVVVVGAAGAIGGFAVQIAKHAGATVVAVTRGLNADYVRRLGADEVIDYSTEDVADAVRKAHPDGVAGIVHTSGGAESLDTLAPLVRKGGHVSSMIGGAKIEDLAKRGVTGINLRTMVTTAVLEQLAGMVDAGALKKPQVKTFTLEQAGAAFQECGAGHVRGKLVVVP